MNKWIGKVAVVTGASSGIGQATFIDLAKAGCKTVGLARRKNLMEEIIKNNASYADNMHALECDLTNKDSIKAAFQWIEENLGGVDLLVNNAGCLRNTTILTEDNEDDLQVILQTNVMGLLICTKEAYKSMAKRDVDGYIVNVNSISGHSVPFMYGMKPSYSIYAGTKHAVTATTEVLRQELIYMKNLKVRVSSVSPGLVKTGIAAAGGYNIDNNMLTRMKSLNPEDVSNAILYLFSTPSHVQISELTIKPTGELF